MEYTVYSQGAGNNRMIKFLINPQDNGPLLKIQAPFIFTHGSMCQHLHALFHATCCTAEASTLQHTLSQGRTAMPSEITALQHTYAAGHCLCTTYRSRRVCSRPPLGALALQRQFQELFLNPGSPQCLTQNDRHCMHRLYSDFLQDTVLKQRPGWHHFENDIQDI